MQITTSHNTVDFNREEVDAAIDSGAEPPPGVVGRRLFGETLLPVRSRPCWRRSGNGQSSVVARHVLLCSLHRPDDWPQWLASARLRGLDGNSGLKLENSSLAYQAALDSLGVAMAQKLLVAEDLAVGRLVAPFSLEVATKGAYFLIYPPQTPQPRKVKLFEKWILEEAARAANGAEA